MPRVHDLSSQMQGGSPIPPHLLQHAIQESLAESGGFVPNARRADQRWDSAGGQVAARPGGVDAYQRRVDRAMLAEMQRRGMKLSAGVQRAYAQHIERRNDEARAAGRRVDALGGGAGGFPRDFEFIRSQVWEEQRQPLNGARVFPRDTSVPLGATSHTARRIVGEGEAHIFRGGTDIARARTAFVEETFGVAYVVCAVETQFFEKLTTDWAGIQQYQNDIAMAKRLVDERRNRIRFNGDAASDLAGVLNYPHLAKQVFPQTIQFGTDPKALVQALNTLANTPQILSGGAFQPNRMLTSIRVARFLKQQKHEQNGGEDTTIWQYFKMGQDEVNGIQSIDGIQEMQGIGPNGEDGILMYKGDKRSIAWVDIQPTTTMPIYQSSPLNQITCVYAADGGTVMGDVGNHILAYAPTNGIG